MLPVIQSAEMSLGLRKSEHCHQKSFYWSIKPYKSGLRVNQNNFEITHNVFGLCFGLASFQYVFVKYPTGVKLGGPDKLLVVEQSVHADNTSVILNVGEDLLPLALVKRVHKTPDFRIIGHVEDSVFWSCQRREQQGG